MDAEIRKYIQDSIAAIEARIPEAEKDLQEAEAAGLLPYIQDNKDKLAAIKDSIERLKAVYNG